jgi:site-specific recombinase XerD
MKLFLRYLAQELNEPLTRVSVRDVSQSLVLRFLDHIEKVRGNSIQTRNHRRAFLRGFFDFVSLDEPMLADHCRTVSDIPFKRGAVPPEVHYLEKNEMQALFDAIDRKSLFGCRDYALLLFMYDTGARAQEAADLRVSWLELREPGRVEIIGKGRKVRTCPLWRSTTKPLETLLQRSKNADIPNAAVFCNHLEQPLGRIGIGHVIGKLHRAAAQRVPSLERKKVSPHCIRHTTAMHLLQSGVEINVIRCWLGHANLQTTYRYVEIDLAMKRRALESCEVRGKRPLGRKQITEGDILMWLDSL